MQRFVDCAAVVTGGGSGIGEAVVRGLFAEGASVVVDQASFVTGVILPVDGGYSAGKGR